MNLIDKAMEIWSMTLEKMQPFMVPVSKFMCELWDSFKVVGRFLYKLRKVFLAVPVAWTAVYLALYNLEHLPTVVGLDLQNSGDFGIQVVKELAILGPIALTAFCLLLMFISRRTLTPWLVSIFSLMLPVIILFTNIFPS